MRITQGATGRRVWYLYDDTGGPITDFAGWDAVAQARAAVGAEAVLHEWSVTAGTIELLAATDTKPAMLRLLTDPDTSSAWEWRTAVYDVLVTNDDGDTARSPLDQLVVTPAVTHTP